MDSSITNKLRYEIKVNYKEKLFTIKDFLHLSNYDTIKRLLVRFENENLIIRIINGIYAIPKYSKLTNELVPVSPNKLAHKIAENFSWKIIPTGLQALNILGLSEQIPVVYEYLSTGPYRDYEYNGKTIKFKNTRSNEINELSYKSSVVVSAIRTLGKSNITKNQVKQIRDNLTSIEKEKLLHETKKVTVWIYEVIKEIYSNGKIFKQ